MSAPNPKSSSKTKPKGESKPPSTTGQPSKPASSTASATSQPATGQPPKAKASSSTPAHPIPSKFNQQLHQASNLEPAAAPATESKKKEATSASNSEATTPKEAPAATAPPAEAVAKPKEGEAKPDGQSEKSAADIRRERREKQEEQRARKAAAAASKPGAAPAAATAAAKPQQAPKQPKPASASTTAPSAAKSASSTTAEANKLASALKTSLKISSNEKQPNQAGEFITTGDTLKLGQRRRHSGDDDELRSSSFRLFHHFDSYKRDYTVTEKFNLDNPQVHPAFIKLGIQLAHEQVSGSNARCIAFLNTLKQFIKSYKAPTRESKTISKDLEAKLKPNINFLTQCRPLAISMGNAIKEIKQIITYLPSDIAESDAKEQLVAEIDNFIREKILIASDTICKYMLADSEIVISGTSYAKSKITNDDCILIYSCSSLVLSVLLRAHKKFPNLKVIVVDSRPKLKGRVSLERLAKHGINCTYVLINAISFVMSRVTKVLLGAHGLLANGYVMSTIGSSQIALVAKSFNVPVVVCCETYKFCDKVQTDAFTNNELSDPSELLRFSKKNLDHKSPLEGLLTSGDFESKENENINVLNLTYDITAPEFISCVVTDMGMLPCTSVPVVLRLKNRDNFLPKKSALEAEQGGEGEKTMTRA